MIAAINVRRSIIATLLYCLLAFATSASAECAWFLWAQQEQFWSYKLLNVIPGPTRDEPYIVGEFESRGACRDEYFKWVQAQADFWKLPETKKDIEKFGGLRSAISYACVPATFKPQRIDVSGSWK